MTASWYDAEVHLDQITGSNAVLCVLKKQLMARKYLEKDDPARGGEERWVSK